MWSVGRAHGGRFTCGVNGPSYAREDQNSQQVFRHLFLPRSGLHAPCLNFVQASVLHPILQSFASFLFLHPFLHFSTSFLHFFASLHLFLPFLTMSSRPSHGGPGPGEGTGEGTGHGPFVEPNWHAASAMHLLW